MFECIGSHHILHDAYRICPAVNPPSCKGLFRSSLFASWEYLQVPKDCYVTVYPCGEEISPMGIQRPSTDGVRHAVKFTGSQLLVTER